MPGSHIEQCDVDVMSQPTGCVPRLAVGGNGVVQRAGGRPAQSAAAGQAPGWIEAPQWGLVASATVCGTFFLLLQLLTLASPVQFQATKGSPTLLELNTQGSQRAQTVQGRLPQDLKADSSSSRFSRGVADAVLTDDCKCDCAL